MLSGQKYRHLDNVRFMDNDAMQNNFIAAWSNKGMAEQCVAWLYGKYVPYEGFEDGVSAEVHAIYEPPQMGGIDSVTLLPDPTNEHVERVAHMLGLIRVGWAITAPGRGFTGLSSSELAAACRFQQMTRIADSPMSRFVTVLLQPNEDASVEPVMWQATDQAVALHRDNILQKPCKPDFCKVRVADKTNNEDFVAPVIYKGNESEEIDVAFLQINGTVTANSGASTGFLKRNTFPTRLFLGKDPTVSELKNEFRRYQGTPWVELLADFNLLVFLGGLQELKDDMQGICTAVVMGVPLEESVQKKLEQYMPSGGGGGGSVPGMNFGGSSAPAIAPAPSSGGGGGNAELRAQLLAMGCDEAAISTVIAAGVTDLESAMSILFA